MFWFKKKKVTLDCFTTDPFVYEYAKISTAVKHLPEWWKQLPKLSNETQNMKRCIGFTTLFKKSFVIPMWSNLQIKMSSVEDRIFECESDLPPIHPEEGVKYPWNPVEWHPKSQFNGFVEDDYQHLKLISPWIFKTNCLVDFHFSDPMWNRKNVSDYSVLSGIVNYKYQMNSHVNIVAQYRSLPRSFSFNPGDPLVMLTPITDGVVEIKNHLIDWKERQRIDPHLRLNKTYNSYSTSKEFLSAHDERNKSKCPLGFSK